MKVLVKPRRPHLLSTSEGSSPGAFGHMEWLLVAALALGWGSSFLWMDIGLDGLAPGTISWIRVVLGAAALALIPRARRPVDRSAWPQLLLLSLIWTAIPMTLFPLAQQWIDSALAGMLNGGVPLTAALWATLLLKRLPGPNQLLGLIVGFVGIVALSLPALAGTDATALGTGLVLVAISLYGLAFNIAVPLQQQHGALPVIFRAQLVAAILLTPWGLIGLRESTWHWPAIVSMLPLGIVGTGLAFVWMTVLVGRVGSARGSIAIYFAPPVAIALGMGFRGDTLTSLHILGAGMVLLGAWLTSRRERLRAPAY